MSRQGESKAFRNGFVLGAIAGAGMMIWNAPQPGWKTREQIVDAYERALFALIDAPEKLAGLRSEPRPEEPEPAPSAAAVPAPPAAEPATDVVIDGPRPSEMPR